MSLTDEATASYKRTPIVDGKRRSEVIEAITNLENLVAQEILDYVAGLKKYRQDFLNEISSSDIWNEHHT